MLKQDNPRKEVMMSTGDWIDIAIVAIVGFSVITGLFRGFVKEAISICVWIMAFWAALHYGSWLNVYVEPYIHDSTAKIVVEFILIFLGVLILGSILNAIISFILHRTGLSATDRVLGMGFGFLRGVFLVVLILIGMQIAGMDSDYLKKSRLVDKLSPLINKLNEYVPQFIEHMKDFENKTKPQNRQDEKTSNKAVIN